MRSECAAPSVARQTFLAEEPQPFTWQGQCDLGPGFKPKQISWFTPPRATASVRRFRFENTELDAQWNVLFQGDQAIHDSKYLIFDEQYDKCLIDPNRLIEQPSDRRFVLARNNGFQDPYHWLMQVLPAIEVGLHESDPASTLALPALQPWQSRSIELLGYAHAPVLTLNPERHYRFPSLEFSEYLNGTASFAISRLAKGAHDRIAQSVPDGASAGSAAIYLRAPRNRETLRNEDELAEQLARAGIAPVSLDDLSFDDCVRALRAASMIVAAHSTAVAYIAFSRPGALLYELFPSHYVNPCMNKLAQANQMDYAADCFESPSDDASWAPGRDWHIDTEQVLRRVETFRQSGPRLARKEQGFESYRELMLSFESLGDNCEFGLVQRHAGTEPVSLLRFASPAIPLEHRARFTAEAIHSKFAGLGAPGTVHLSLEGKPGRREYIGHESVYHLQYHTFKIEGEIDPVQFAQSECRRLEFLGAKLMRDLQGGEKIWLWKSNLPTSAEAIKDLLEALRSHGPNRLLWVSLADEDHPHGTIEQIYPDLVKAYIDRLAPYDNAPNISFDSWVEICRKAKQAFDETPAPAPAPSTRVPTPSVSSPITTINERNRAAMKDCLRGWAPLIAISVETRGEHGLDLAREIADVFSSSGATVALSRQPRENNCPDQVSVILPIIPGAEALVACQALTSGGLAPQIALGAPRARTSVEVTIGP